MSYANNTQYYFTSTGAKIFTLYLRVFFVLILICHHILKATQSLNLMFVYSKEST